MNNEILIEKLIVHKIDHLKHSYAQLSDLETPIPDDVGKFLRKHIISNREHRFTNIAKFVNKGKSQAVFKNVFDELLGNRDQFVDKSKKIAGHLFSIVSKNRAISPSDLIICTFREVEEKSHLQLALLKMDPEDGFVGQREVDANGKARIVLKPVGDVLPTGALQKCAFIFPQSMRKEKGYDLKVLDMQRRRYNIQAQVASFFTKDFLQCETPPASEEQTYLFIDKSEEWIDKKESVWDIKDVENFHKHLTDSIMRNTADVVNFAMEGISKSEEQDDYISHMKAQGLHTFTFTPSPEVRSHFLKYTWFYGDDGLRVRINKNEVGKGKVLDYYKDDAVGDYVITIRTIKWKEKQAVYGNKQSMEKYDGNYSAS
jgi:hypothetical protein